MIAEPSHGLQVKSRLPLVCLFRAVFGSQQHWAANTEISRLPHTHSLPQWGACHQHPTLEWFMLLQSLNLHWHIIIPNDNERLYLPVSIVYIRVHSWCCVLYDFDTCIVTCFPGGSEVKSFCFQCGRPGFNPWVGKIPWRRKWQPTPVFFPGESREWRSLVDPSPWGHKESDTTERLHYYYHHHYSDMHPPL